MTNDCWKRSTILNLKITIKGTRCHDKLTVFRTNFLNNRHVSF